MYEYKLHWIKTGKVEVLTGNSITDACAKVGYDASKIMMSECILYTNQPYGYGRNVN